MSVPGPLHSCNHLCGLLGWLGFCRVGFTLLKCTVSDSQNCPSGAILKRSCRELWVVCKLPVMEFG